MEKTFWAQLPANFSFLSRMKPTILDNVAALASLHNFPTGNQYNPWGKAITLLRTEKGTPFFMNFHDENELTTTCIFGEAKAGKTTLLNFLLSEADKFYPTTVYITDDMDSGIYTKARSGKWFQISSSSTKKDWSGSKMRLKMTPQPWVNFSIGTSFLKCFKNTMAIQLLLLFGQQEMKMYETSLSDFL